MTVPGGCRSQGCHGYLERSPLMLLQAPSPHPSIVDGFNITFTSFYYTVCLLVNSIMIAFLPPKRVEKKHERLQLKHIREGTSTLITH